MDAARRPLFGDPVLLVLLVVSLVGNVYLALPHTPALARSPSPPRSGLARGTAVAALTGVTGSGSPATISLKNDRPTVVFAYSPKCQWCIDAWPLIQELARRQADHYRFVALCYGEPSDIFPADFAVLARPSAKTTEALQITGVPQTVVFSAAGTVERVWRGGFTETRRDEVLAYFGVSPQ